MFLFPTVMWNYAGPSPIGWHECDGFLLEAVLGVFRSENARTNLSGYS